MNFIIFKTSSKHSLITALLALLINCAEPTTDQYEYIEKDASFRSEILKREGGNFIQLNDGFTYYREGNINLKKMSSYLSTVFQYLLHLNPTYQTLKSRIQRPRSIWKRFFDNLDTDYTIQWPIK